MRTLAKAVEHHDVDALRALNCLVRQLVAVAYVRDAARTLGEKVSAARKTVLDFNALNRHTAN